uniref:KANL3/Tex30 alpha/beta hydrolase-like domain-containing protein n=1 Tax=Glycine max TaxID=3847 RepID=A0A0R0IFX5_SOYBN
MDSLPPAKRRRESKDGETEASTLSPVVIFAHGAGAPSSSDWMQRWKNMIKEALRAVDVVTFDYPYMSAKKKAPPKAEKLVEFHSNFVKETATKYPGHPLILAGKSMGSRVGCMVASMKDINVSAVVCLGYPLKGSKDGLCPLEKLETTRKKMKAPNELHVIDGGDHSFKIGKKHLQANNSTQDEVEDVAVLAIAAFISRSLEG